jgi:hypothetical protein
VKRKKLKAQKNLCELYLTFFDEIFPQTKFAKYMLKYDKIR